MLTLQQSGRCACRMPAAVNGSALRNTRPRRCPATRRVHSLRANRKPAPRPIPFIHPGLAHPDPLSHAPCTPPRCRSAWPRQPSPATLRHPSPVTPARPCRHPQEQPPWTEIRWSVCSTALQPHCPPSRDEAGCAERPPVSITTPPQARQHNRHPVIQPRAHHPLPKPQTAQAHRHGNRKATGMCFCWARHGSNTPGNSCTACNIPPPPVAYAPSTWTHCPGTKSSAAHLTTAPMPVHGPSSKRCLKHRACIRPPFAYSPKPPNPNFSLYIHWIRAFAD